MSDTAAVFSPVTTERRYTLSEIKAAFWESFYGAGELWFGEVEGQGPEYAEEKVEGSWQGFIKDLNSTV